MTQYQYNQHFFTFFFLVLNFRGSMQDVFTHSSLPGAFKCTVFKNIYKEKYYYNRVETIFTNFLLTFLFVLVKNNLV